MRMSVGRSGEGWVHSILPEESKVAVDRVPLWRDVFICDRLITNCSISITVPNILTQI
jgi:hypothetical protein